MADEEVWQDWGDEVFQDVATEVWQDTGAGPSVDDNKSPTGLLLGVLP